MFDRHGLAPVVWQFRGRLQSHCARKSVGPCPALNLWLPREAQLVEEGIDLHRGNWDDTWRLTEPLRDDLNAILTRHALGSDLVSPHTFVFPHSWDRVAHDCLGRLLKPAVLSAIAGLLPPLKRGLPVETLTAPRHIFWHSSGRYFVVFENERAFENALPHLVTIKAAVEAVFAEADVHGDSANLGVDVEIMHLKTKNLDLHGMGRED